MEFNINRRLTMGWLLALLTLPLPALSQDPPRPSEEAIAESQPVVDDPSIRLANDKWMKASRTAIQQHARVVAARSDARSLLAAAMISNGFRHTDNEKGDAGWKPEAETQAWFDAAAGIRPREVLVAQIEANGCGLLSEHCDASDALAFLLQAEPGNAAVQLLAVADAERRGDRASADRHWQAAAEARTYESHTLAVSQLLYAGMQGVDYPPLDPALARAMGSWVGLQRPATAQDIADVGAIAMVAALAMPGLSPVTHRCKATFLGNSNGAIREQCRHVLELLTADESLVISPMIGLTSLVQLNGDTVEGKVWRERLRQFYWVFENAMSRMIGTTGGPLPAEYGRWFMTEGEFSALRKLIAHYGLPAQAPADWLPVEPYYRALVTTGRPPVETN